LKFADDTKIFGPICDYNDYMVFQEDLNRLFSWSTDWQMAFNIDKCKVIHFGKNNKAYSYCLDGLPLTEVTEEKDLGVIISKDLKVSSSVQRRTVKQTKCWELSIGQLLTNLLTLCFNFINRLLDHMLSTVPPLGAHTI